MKIIIKNISENPVSLLRRTGYTFQRQEGEEMSFVRALASSGYPRFHCYTKLRDTDLILSLHIDHKKHTYGETTRHHGEYDNTGPVGEEGARLLGFFGNKASLLYNN